jgi:hypothetical protein
MSTKLTCSSPTADTAKFTATPSAEAAALAPFLGGGAQRASEAPEDACKVRVGSWNETKSRSNKAGEKKDLHLPPHP